MTLKITKKPVTQVKYKIWQIFQKIKNLIIHSHRLLKKKILKYKKMNLILTEFYIAMIFL